MHQSVRDCVGLGLSLAPECAGLLWSFACTGVCGIAWAQCAHTCGGRSALLIRKESLSFHLGPCVRRESLIVHTCFILVGLLEILFIHLFTDCVWCECPLWAAVNSKPPGPREVSSILHMRLVLKAACSCSSRLVRIIVEMLRPGITIWCNVCPPDLRIPWPIRRQILRLGP